MTPALIENVRARYESGYSLQRIANELRLKRSDVHRAIVLSRPPKQVTPKVERRPRPAKAPVVRSTTPNAARKRLQEMQEAVAELLADGCDPAIVAANFGAIT